MRKKSGRIGYWLVLLTAFIIAVIFGWRLASPGEKKETFVSPQTLLKQLLSCPPGENNKSYLCTVPYVKEYLKNSSINSFFTYLEEGARVNGRAGGYCHAIGHSVGRALHDTYGYIEALNMCRATCADGCTMGVMEAFLLDKSDEHASTDLIITKADEACKEYAAGNPLKRSACMHGSGHGLMPLIQYDTASALDLCSKLDKAVRGNCYDAVFMEKFLPSDAARNIAKTDDLYLHCASYSNQEQKYRCFGYLPYAWQAWGKKPEEILQLCASSDGDKEACGRALSRLYIPHFLTKNNTTFFDVFHKAPPEIQRSMIKFGSIYVIEYAPSKSHDFCRLVGKEDCMNNIRLTAQDFEVEIPQESR